jgi:hypothetical protein
VRSLAVSCWQCHHEAVLSAGRWPDDVPLPSFGPRMVCTRCGIIVSMQWGDPPAPGPPLSRRSPSIAYARLSAHGCTKLLTEVITINFFSRVGAGLFQQNT